MAKGCRPCSSEPPLGRYLSHPVLSASSGGRGRLRPRRESVGLAIVVPDMSSAFPIVVVKWRANQTIHSAEILSMVTKVTIVTDSGVT
jgi:hypothetical protein